MSAADNGELRSQVENSNSQDAGKIFPRRSTPLSQILYNTTRDGNQFFNPSEMMLQSTQSIQGDIDTLFGGALEIPTDNGQITNTRQDGPLRDFTGMGQIDNSEFCSPQYQVPLQMEPPNASFTPNAPFTPLTIPAPSNLQNYGPQDSNGALQNGLFDESYFNNYLPPLDASASLTPQINPYDGQGFNHIHTPLIPPATARYPEIRMPPPTSQITPYTSQDSNYPHSPRSTDKPCPTQGTNVPAPELGYLVSVFRKISTNNGKPLFKMVKVFQPLNKSQLMKIQPLSGPVQQRSKTVSLEAKEETNPKSNFKGRKAGIANYHAEDYYKSLQQPPRRWGPFKYTIHGELNPRQTYSVEEIKSYLFKHPLHQTPQGYNPKKGGLILWIQRHPADSARRYPDKDHSSRCRFTQCFSHKNLIAQAAYRVAFDEQTCQRSNHNPMHNAGYVHLYCLERFFNFPEICKNFDVRVEQRCLPKEPRGINRMKMSNSAEDELATKFIRSCEEDKVPATYPPATGLDDYQFFGSLVNLLTLKKIEKEPPKTRQQREERGERQSVVSMHQGDLVKESRNRLKSRALCHQTRRKCTPPSDSDSEASSSLSSLFGEEDEASESENEDLNPKSPKRKRNFAEGESDASNNGEPKPRRSKRNQQERGPAKKGKKTQTRKARGEDGN